MILHGRKAMVQQISGLRPLSAKIVKSSRQISQNLAILKTFSTQNKCITNLLSNIIEIRNRKSQRKWKRYLHVLTTIQDIIPCTQRLRNQDVGIIMTPPPPTKFLLFGYYYTLYKVDNLLDLVCNDLAFTKQSKSGGRMQFAII